MNKVLATIALATLFVSSSVTADSPIPQWVINGLADQIYAKMKSDHLPELEPHDLPEIVRVEMYKGGEEQFFPNSFILKFKLTDGLLRGLSSLERIQNATMFQTPDKLYQLTIPSGLTNVAFTMNAHMSVFGLKLIFNVTGKMDAIHFTTQFETDGEKTTKLQSVSVISDMPGLDFDLTMTSPETCKFIDSIMRRFKGRIEKQVPSIANECLDKIFQELFATQ